MKNFRNICCLTVRENPRSRVFTGRRGVFNCDFSGKIFSFFGMSVPNRDKVPSSLVNTGFKGKNISKIWCEFINFLTNDAKRR